MSLVAVHIIKVNNTPTSEFVALNTGKITKIEDHEGHAFFRFVPFSGREELMLIEESVQYLLNAPVQSDSVTETFTTVGGTLSVAKENILKVYPHASAERTYMQTVSGTTISLHVLKMRLEEVINQVNTCDVDSISGDLSLSGDLSVSGDIAVTGHVTVGEIWHAYGGFTDQSVQVTCTTKNTWYHITNLTKNLWSGDEGEGITLSDDVMTMTNAGIILERFLLLCRECRAGTFRYGCIT